MRNKKLYLKYFLIDDLVIGFCNGDPKSTEMLAGVESLSRLEMGISKNPGMIFENCRICLERYISDGYKQVAQEVLIAIWNQRDNPKMKDHPGSFATTINERKIIDALRKINKSKETLDSDISSHSDEGSDASDSWIDNQVFSETTKLDDMIEEEQTSSKKELAKKVLDKLFGSDDVYLKDTHKNGKILLAYQLQEKLSIDEFAEMMDVPEETIKNWISEFVQKNQIPYEKIKNAKEGTKKSLVSRYKVHLRKELYKQGLNQEFMGF